MSARDALARVAARAGVLRHPAPAPARPPQSVLELARSGAVPLAPRGPTGVAPQQLHIATVVPSFRRGSGGHATIVHLLRELRALGNTVSVWLEDNEGRHAREAPEELTSSSFAEFFHADGLEFHCGFESWSGAEVVLATGWQTVSRVLRLEGASARAYLVQDHEPDFYGASAERAWAEDTYRRGLHCVAASEWLADLLRDAYGASAAHFDLAVDHAVYRPSPERRRENLVLFYARAVTPRRAVPLGLLALEELARRRPGVEIALYGEQQPLGLRCPHKHLGVLAGRDLAEHYSRGAVGMVLSMTNPSLVGLEMMACGLPVVELASEPMVATFGTRGPMQLAQGDPLELCAGIERLLDDRERSERVSHEGLELVRERTWARAATQVHGALLGALAREPAA